MIDEFLFFALLGLLYGIECYFLLHKHSVAFREGSGGRCKITLASSNSGSRDRAIHLYQLFPPLRPVYFSHILPVSMNDQGILAYISQTLTENGRPRQTGLVMEFGEIRSVRTEDDNLILNDTCLVSCREPEQAALIAEKIDEIVNNPGKKVQDVLHDLVNSILDYEQVKRIVSEYRIKSDDLRIISNSVFILLFVFFPVMTLWKGFGFSLLATVILFVVMTPLLCYFFLSLHSQYFPGEKNTRISSIIRFVLWPLSAIRANDLLVHGILSQFHPIAVALALCSKSDAVEFTRKILRDLQHPISQSVGEELALSIDHDWRILLVKFVKEKAGCMGIREQELEVLPSPSDPSVIAYCPRCLTQFSAALGVCPDCLGVSTVFFNRLERS